MKRKHRLQMSQEEIDFVEYVLYAMSGWVIESALIHAAKKGRKFTQAEVLQAIKTGRVIEVNSYGRVLIRSAKGVCVVVSLCDRLAITVWFNAPHDNHKTLKRNEYTWDVNVISYIKNLRSTR